MNGSQTSETFYTAYHRIHIYAAPALSGVGILNNLFMIFVLSRRKMRSPINLMLASIAICDSLVMFTYFVYQVNFELIPYKCIGDRRTYAAAVFVMAHVNLSIPLRSCSLWISAAMAGYRSHVIKRNPVIGKQTVENFSISVTLVLGCITGVLITSIPVFLVHEIRSVREPKVDGNSTCPAVSYKVYISKFAEDNNGFVLRLALWCMGIFQKLCPVTILGVYIIRLIRDLCKYGTYRTTQMPNSHFQSCYFLPGTLILTVILLVTFLLETPNAIVSALVAITSSLKEGKILYYNLGDIFDICSVLTSVTTFPLYCGMSSIFRETAKAILCSWRRAETPQEEMRILQGSRVKKYDDFRMNKDDNYAFDPDSPTIECVDL